MSRPRRRVDVVARKEAGAGENRAAAGSAISAQLHLIESSKATERARGVQELATLLREDQRGRRTLGASIPAGAWEQVVSWTAGIIIKESQAYVNKFGEEWPQVSAAGDRLSSRIQMQYAGPIRHIWVAAMPYLAPKLARFLTKHMTETMERDPCLTHVFGLDYSKVLRAWAAHMPHVYGCKDGRAKAIVAWCIGSLGRTSGTAESQMSTGSSVEPTIQAGDAELAAALLAVVSAATPARLAGLSESVLEFCTEYCRQHTRENACTATVLETMNTVLLVTADTYLAQCPDRVRLLLEAVLHLWPTRTPHVKQAVLHSVRILTRLVAQMADTQADVDARALLELALKTMTAGAWDRQKFMQLPRELLTLWPLLGLRAGAAIAPVELFAPLHVVVEAGQLAFFDTVAYLAARLTRLQQRAADKDDAPRRKRARKAPTSLARLVTAMGSDDAAAGSRGAAQAIWYAVAVYPHVLGARQCTELLAEIEAMVQSSDMSQRADLAEWVLGIMHMLAQATEHPYDMGILQSTAAATKHAWGEDVWQHAIAGAEAGLAGAANLVFAVLHRPGTRDLHAMCQQAATALSARTVPHGADSARLLLFLAQYIKPRGDSALAKAASRAILQVCDSAAKQHWPPALFSTIATKVLGFADQHTDQSSSVFGPDWTHELRFAHVLHSLTLLSDNHESCTQLLRHHMQARPVRGVQDAKVSNISPGQWQQVSTLLLECIERCTTFELDQAQATSVPYVAHAVWRVAEHVQREALLSDGVVSENIGAQIAQLFSERFMAFVTEMPSAELVWQTMLFVAPWTDGYARVAALAEPMDRLLTVLFQTGDARLLCALASGDAASRLVGSLGLNSSSTDPSQSVARLDADGQLAQQQRAQLEARMLGAGIVPAPGAEITRVLSALAAQRATLAPGIALKLAAAIERLDDTQFLLAAEILARCCISDGGAALLGQLKERMLSFLDNHNFTGHMPTMFCALRVVSLLLHASNDNVDLAADEDLARFVAWLDTESRQGRVDAFVDVELLRGLLGPWSRAARGEYVVLTILETSAVGMLVRRAQASGSTVSRLVAEEQLARLGLTLPYVLDDGRVAYPEAPATDADDELVLMTRDFGLVLLACNTRTVPPGVLLILLCQLRERAELPVCVAALCHRLLACMAAVLGLSGVSQLAAECASDVLAVDLELHATLVGLLSEPNEPQLECRINASAALEWMLRGEYAQAREALSSIDAAAYSDTHVSWLLAHVYAATEDNAERRTQLISLVLEPWFTRERIAELTEKHAERIILELLQLHRPDPDLRTELQYMVRTAQKDRPELAGAAAFTVICEQRQPLAQWGRRYSLVVIRGAVTRVGGALTDSVAMWLALHVDLRLQSARSDDQREPLALALAVLAGLAESVFDSELVSAVLPRLLADTWLCGGMRTAPLIGLAAAVLANRATAETGGRLVVGMACALTQKLPEMTNADGVQAASMLAALVHACARASDPLLFVSRELESLCDWEVVASALTRDKVQRLDDRMELARICKLAAAGIGTGGYTDVCAEFIAGAAERIVHLALPSADADAEAVVRVDISAMVADTLADARQLVIRDIHECNPNERSPRVKLLLQRAVTLLRAMSDKDLESDHMIADTDTGKLKNNGDLRWLVCEGMRWPFDGRTALAAMDAAERLNHVELHAKAAWLDARHKRLLRAIVAMPPPEHKRAKPVARALDLGFLETLCGDRSCHDALSELVAALAARPECIHFHPILGLVRANAQTAMRVLPHVIHELLRSHAPADVCEATAAFLLDFAHNWSVRAPNMAYAVIQRTLETRQLDARYADIREFIKQLPLALFEMADLAVRLGQNEAAAFLLECDLTCTGTGTVSIDGVTGAARELLRTTYGQLGNAAAARMLGSVTTVDDVQRRCRDAGDWRTLLLYQEAAPARSGIGDTLVQLGLLNAVRPGGADTDADAMNAAAWRLARWDEPALPLDLDSAVPDTARSREPETQLYRMFRLRAHGHVRAAALAAQAFMETPQAMAALSVQRGRREAWVFHAVGALLPLVGGSVDRALGRHDAVQASRTAMFVLARFGSVLGADALDPVHVANLTLHEVALRENSDAFARYASAARAACVAARQAGAWQTAMNHVFRVRAEAGSMMAAELRLWEAETLWDAGSRHLAVEMLQAHKRVLEQAQSAGDSMVISPMQTPQASSDMVISPVQGVGPSAALPPGQSGGDAATILLSRVILAVGEWSAEQRTERATVLWEEYFKKAANLLHGVATPTAWTGRALHALAGFAERQCAEMTATRDSDAAVAMRTQKARELAACKSELAAAHGADAARLRAVLRRLEVQAAGDQRELNELRTGIGGFLRLAVWAFARCLECTDAFDLCAYPLVALIVTHSRAPEFHEELKHVDSVPSHKLLPLVRQLCARLSTDNDAFHATVRRVVTRMATDYPHHTLSHLFALCNADRTAPRPERRPALGSESARLEKRRSDAATSILRSVGGISADLKQIVGAVDELCSAYIELAVAPVPEKYRGAKLEGRLIAFGGRLRIARLRAELPPGLPVLTAEPRADAPRDYTSVPFVSSVSDGYSLAGGINLPKIVRILGSDGRRYKQLVKGKDDLRQDAVIQQLFTVINRFLDPRDSARESSGAAVAAGLRMRTYQVVPLTKRCGVLQWVDNTQPFGNWFRVNEAKYRPAAPSMSQQRAAVHA
ncbi:hypothetical protein GGF43_001668, partial [Coemansia sp. RSA 2618]